MTPVRIAASLAALIVVTATPLMAAEPAPPMRADLYFCEGCEAALERDAAALEASAVIAGPTEPGERLVLSGIVFASDGATPAPDVVVYAYHTNDGGLYADGAPDTVWSRRHGALRGWARSDGAGRYRFETIKPGVYPDRSEPAHIHLTVAEPGRTPYWIDSVVFEGEFGVDVALRADQQRRGGSGIVRLSREDGIWRARRDIVLERHPD